MSDTEEDGAGRREVAYRLFAAEYDDADLSYSEGEEERAPNYVVTPTGARVNRTFVVGVLTEVEAVSDDVLRARVVDPTGAFVLYAGQYQPDEQAFLDRTGTPTFVAVTGKARTFQPEDSQQVYTSLRPESINEVDADTRDRWTVGTAEQTLWRVGQMAGALARDERGDQLEAALVADGVDEGLASGIALALDHYDTSPAYLTDVRELALDAARLVAGEIDEVEPLSTRPDAPGEADLDALADVPGIPDADADSTAPVASADDASAPTESDAVGATADAGSGTTTDAGDEAADVGDFEPGEFELDEEEREEIESEFGTEFQSGTEVDEPGQTDIGTPEPEESESEPAATDDARATTGTVADETGGDGATGEGSTDETRESDEDSAADADLADVDLEDATVEVMGELDDGGGTRREALVETVAERYGASPEEVEDAIQDALMDGRCYEPDDATLKPI